MTAPLRSLRPLATLPVLFFFAAAPGVAEFSERFTFDGRSLFVGNLIGEIHVEGHDGDDFEVQVDAKGEDVTRERLRIETRQGSNGRLLVIFPLKEERRYVYPRLRGRTTIAMRSHTDRGDSWLRDLIEAFTSDRIRVSRSGSGLEVWADVTIRVPAGRALEVDHGVGEVRLAEVEGELSIDVSSGGVAAQGVTGSLRVDTGSGGVELARIAGNLVVDTGSGAVRLSDYDGDQLSIDTGSGSVEAVRIRSRRLVIDTGSGGVEARQVSCEGALIDTGSGSVTLELAEMGEGRYEIDTGSGSVTLLVPANASAEVSADTGSGGIHVDLPAVRTLYKERNEMRFRVGRGGADVVLDTGSGSIHVAQSRS